MSHVYTFDPFSLRPTGTVQCQVCPKTGAFLRPLNSLPEAPPQYSSGIVIRAIDGEWVGDLQASIAEALEAVDRQHAEALRKVTGNATLEERDTWAQKAAAARAVLDGSATASQASMIALEAKEKGLTLQEMADRVAKNASSFEYIVGVAAGFRALARKSIQATKDCDELDGVLKHLSVELSKTIAEFEPK